MWNYKHHVSINTGTGVTFCVISSKVKTMYIYMTDWC